MFTFWQSICTVVAYALDFKGASYQFMFGSSWGVRISLHYIALTSHLTPIQFLSFGPLCLLPISRYWMKDTLVISADISITMERIPHRRYLSNLRSKVRSYEWNSWSSPIFQPEGGIVRAWWYQDTSTRS